ncbi:MAG TPA: LptF/LptG family permease, partial [Thermoanaerobaculia bacterium]|nr:LptF/LptG family permease [Thermoanaerobaculia bacterium]
MMRLVSRSVLREIWPPFLLGFVAYTFILLIRTVYFLADFFVRRSASFGEVAWLAVLSLPWIIVLTLPMAFLLGVLIGIGRLAGDSEIIALRSCGVGPLAIYRPAVVAAIVLSGGVFYLYNLVLPGANEKLTRSLARVAATSVVNVVHPRTFREVRSGVTLYFDSAGADGRSLEGVFVKLGEEGERDQRVMVARRGALTLESDRLYLDLFNSTVHEYDGADPAHYRLNRSQAQRVLLAGDIWNASASVAYEKGLRNQSVRELMATAERTRGKSPENYRLAWVEIHKKFSIPFACLAFAIIGIPLAESARRGGRGSAFAISLAIIILYYVLLSAGETWGRKGVLPPALAIWLPNIVVLGAGAAAIARSGRERARWRWTLPLAGRRVAGRPASPAAARPRFGSFVRFPGILDRYVLQRFLTVLFFAAVSVLLLAVIVDYAERVERIARNHPPTSAVLGYYRAFLLGIG